MHYYVMFQEAEDEATQSEMFDAKDEVGTSPKLVIQSLCVLMNQTFSIMCIKFHTYLCVCVSYIWFPLNTVFMLARSLEQLKLDSDK